MIQQLIEFFKPHIVPLICAVAIVAVLPLLAGYVVLLERKVMADMQARLGPMRVGPHGLLQPIADAVKLLLKEDIIPGKRGQMAFLVCAVAFGDCGDARACGGADRAVVSNRGSQCWAFVFAGRRLMGIYGIVLGGWASNSHYSLLGALRSAAQLVSYETAAGMAMVSGVMFGGALSTRGIGGCAGAKPRVVYFSRAGGIFSVLDRVNRGNESRAI